MPRAGFYNDNEYRAYPFVFNANFDVALLPNSTIVDAGIIMGLLSAFDATQHRVWLESINRADDVFTFSFRTDAPGAASEPLTFTRSAHAVEWQSEQVVSDNWEGFLVTGPLTELAAQLPNGNAITIANNTARTLEPARIQSLVKSYLRAINLGNYRRTLVTPAPACAGSDASSNTREIAINATNMQGNLRLKEGYNCRITQIDFNNELRVSAAVGAGASPDAALCGNGGEIPLNEEDAPPPGSPFLSGGPSCDETISTVNGISGSNISIVGGTGVSVTTDSANATVRVALDNNNLVGKCGT